MSFVLLLAFLCMDAGAQQNPFMNDAVGRPLYLQTNYTAEGSPYLYENYRPAEITTTNNRVYKDVNVKINLAENIVQFINDRGEELVATIPIKQIRLLGLNSTGGLQELVFLSLNKSINTPNDSVYQVLDSGRVSLLAHVRVNYRDEKRYGQAGITRIFKTSYTYYIWRDGKKERLERNKDAVLQALADKRTEVEAYVRKESLGYRSENDLAKIFRFYNSSH